MKQLLYIVAMGVWAAGAWAHSPLKATVPADATVVAAAPIQITMDFRGNIRLTRVNLTYQDLPSVALDLDGFAGFIKQYDIPIEPMGSGVYLIEWRGLGDDGHTQAGSFSFSVEE